MRMNIIFCQSYLNIPITISLLEKFEENYIIITSNKSTYRFFSDFVPKEKIVLFDNPKSIFVISPIHLVKNLSFNMYLKKLIRNYFSDYQNCNVYFFLYAFAEEMAYAVRYLSQNQNTIFHTKSTEIKDGTFNPKSNIFTFMKKIQLKLFYGLNVDSVELKPRYFFPYNQKFFTKINVKSIDLKPDKIILKHFVKEKLCINTNKILLLSGGSEHITKKYNYSEIIDALIRAFGKDKLVLKLHPRYNTKQSLENNLDEIPSYIPANILAYSFDTIIGYVSSTLYEAANIGKTVISLLEIIKPYSLEYKQTKYKYMIDNLKPEKRIHFPKSINDIKQIIPNEHK